MSSKNKFGFDPIGVSPEEHKRERSVGPMGAAVREAAQSLQETTEAKVEQRRQNAKDAKAWREAQATGRVLVSLFLNEVNTDDLPRDRLDLESVAASDEMEELKASIRERGQKEPIEVYVGDDGRYQLKKGWRRLTALKQLVAETGEDRFTEVIARVEYAAETNAEDISRMSRYIDMVEENVVREDLTFAEMAQVAITAAQDAAIDESDADVLVGRLYGSLHKMKRSYIRSFVYLLGELGGDLQWPKDVSRNVGVEVSRVLKAQPERAGALRRELQSADTREEQSQALSDFLAGGRRARSAKGKGSARQKFEFHVGDLKVTARRGECRIVSNHDFAEISREKLERAIRAFEEALRRDDGPRIRSLGKE
ncbi:ParB/RepB/Spo0J family partition protein [Qingshengfaniella alkalisoli]|uniref:Chromosome partitioning protein ParB n=1 Tax=Qingshengfaniella alkalisoli TaxID=2599296 RepID=A0A5B8J9X8_9RHOB|nr:ParB N-terminal domain-containing protein [Qingshengfaniella alkalisoli]QDY71030.1 chromosome partitioning protein ParB [Qingshengfaniella alkalisoli]